MVVSKKRGVYRKLSSGRKLSKRRMNRKKSVSKSRKNRKTIRRVMRSKRRLSSKRRKTRKQKGGLGSCFGLGCKKKKADITPDSVTLEANPMYEKAGNSGVSSPFSYVDPNTGDTIQMMGQGNPAYRMDMTGTASPGQYGHYGSSTSVVNPNFNSSDANPYSGYSALPRPGYSALPTPGGVYDLATRTTQPHSTPATYEGVGTVVGNSTIEDVGHRQEGHATHRDTEPTNAAKVLTGRKILIPQVTRNLGIEEVDNQQNNEWLKLTDFEGQGEDDIYGTLDHEGSRIEYDKSLIETMVKKVALLNAVKQAEENPIYSAIYEDPDVTPMAGSDMDRRIISESKIHDLPYAVKASSSMKPISDMRVDSAGMTFFKDYEQNQNDSIVFILYQGDVPGQDKYLITNFCLFIKKQIIKKQTKGKKTKGKKEFTYNTYSFTYNPDNEKYTFPEKAPTGIFEVGKEYTFFQFLRRIIILTLPPHNLKFLRNPK